MAQTTPTGTPPAAPSAPINPTGATPAAPVAPAADPMQKVLEQLAKMQKQIDDLEKENKRLRGVDGTEKGAREQGDKNLNGRVDNEAKDRKAVDENLKARGDAQEAAIKGEATAREAGDKALGGRVYQEIKDRKADDKALGGRIDKEAADRKAGDDALQGDLNKEAVTRANEDSAVNKRVTDETAAREQGDKKLQKGLNKEGKARKEGDEKLQGALDKETGEREAADLAHDETLEKHDVRLKYVEGEVGMKDVFDKEFEDESIGIKKLADETGVDVSGLDTGGNAYTLKGADAKKIKEARDKLENAGDRAGDKDKQAYRDAVQHAVDNVTTSKRIGGDDVDALKGAIAESRKGQKSVNEAAGGTGKSSQERALAIGEQLVALGMDATKGNYAKITGDKATHELGYASNKGLDSLEKAIDRASKDNLITPQELKELSSMYNDRVLDPGIHKIPTDKAAAAANKAAGPTGP